MKEDEEEKLNEEINDGEMAELSEEEENELSGGAGSKTISEGTYNNIVTGSYADSFELPKAKFPVTIYKNNCYTIRDSEFSYENRNGRVVATVILKSIHFGGIYGDIKYEGKDGKRHILRVRIMFK